MWWEAIPSFGIVFACTAGLSLGQHLVCYVYNNQPYRRKVHDRRDLSMLVRDRNYSRRDFVWDLWGKEHVVRGNPYKSFGLEALDDK